MIFIYFKLRIFRVLAIVAAQRDKTIIDMNKLLILSTTYIDFTNVFSE